MEKLYEENGATAVKETLPESAAPETSGGAGEKKVNNRIRRGSMSVFKIVFCVILFIYSVSQLIPILWGVITSLKTSSEFRYNVLGLPREITFQNYIQAFELLYIDVAMGGGITMRIRLAQMFLYSILYAGGCGIMATLTACVMGYATAKFAKFKMSSVIYTIVVVAMVLPIIGNLPSEIQMSRALGLYDTMWGIWIMKMSFLGMYFLVFNAMFKGIPQDYAEAAYLDGASEFRIMVNIYFPLARYTFFTVLLLNFITYWNDYQIPLIYIPSYPTVAFGVFTYSNSNSTMNTSVPSRITASIIMLVPILILFLIFHERLIGNVSMGGIKE